MTAEDRMTNALWVIAIAVVAVVIIIVVKFFA